MDEKDETGDAPEPIAPPEDAADGPHLPFTSADFHNVVQKHVVNAVYEALVDQKLEWAQVAPFLESARDICRSDFQESAELRIHAVRADADDWVEAEEAYLGISVVDRDDGHEWLSESYWLSELVLAEDDPEQVRAIVRALERSLAKINAWLAEKEAGGAAEAAPPADDPSS